MIRMSYVIGFMIASMTVMTEANETPRFGIAKLLSVDGVQQPSNLPSYFVRLDLKQDSQPFEIATFEYIRRENAKSPIVQKGVIGLQANRVMLTLPGPRVDRVVIGSIEAPSREISFERRAEEVLFQAEKLNEIKEKMKKLGYEGDDASLEAYLKEQRVKVLSQREVWLINDFKLSEGIVIDSVTRAEPASIRTLGLESWGRGLVSLNIHAACEDLIKNVSTSMSANKSPLTGAQFAANRDSLFYRALRELK